MIKMNEDIEKLKDKLKKTLENYELDKKFGQLSVDSIYSMFPTESKILLDYIEYLEKQVCDFCLDNIKLNDYQLVLAREKEQLQNNWNELKKWLEEEYKYVPTYYCRMIRIMLNKMQEMEQGKDENN